jgi:hypothetical protein
VEYELSMWRIYGSGRKGEDTSGRGNTEQWEWAKHAGNRKVASIEGNAMRMERKVGSISSLNRWAETFWLNSSGSSFHIRSA